MTNADDNIIAAILETLINYGLRGNRDRLAIFFSHSCKCPLFPGKISFLGLNLDGGGSGGDESVVGVGSSVDESTGVTVGSDGTDWVDGTGNDAVGGDGGWGSSVTDGGGGWGSGVADGGGGHWGGVVNSLLDGNWVRDGVSLLLNDWSLNDVLDLVDWVGLGDSVWSWHLNLVWLGHVLVDNDLPLDWSGHGHWNIDLVLVDLQFWLDPGGLWGDDGVGPGWGQHLLVGHGVSWGGSQVDRCWWDGSVWSGGNWGSWDGQLLGHNLVGGWGVDLAVSGRLVHGLSSLDVLVSNLDGPGASLDGAVSDDAVLHVGLGNSWSGMHSLLDVGGSGTVAYDSGVNWGGDSSCMVGQWEGGSGVHGWVVSRSGAAESCQRSQNQKSSHFV